MDSNTDKRICKNCGSEYILEYRSRRFDAPKLSPLLVCLTCNPKWKEETQINSIERQKHIKTGISKNGFNFVENLEIFSEEIPKVTWYEVFEINLNLKDGWKIPNIKELELLFKSRAVNNIFKSTYYWSIDDGNDNHAWAMSINNGFKPLMNKNKKFSALIIREMQNGSKEN